MEEEECEWKMIMSNKVVAQYFVFGKGREVTLYRTGFGSLHRCSSRGK
jgi:hypothetical protein